MNESKKKMEPKKIVKEYFTVKVEAMVPVTFTYRVLAETPEEAVAMISRPGQHQESAPPRILFHAARKIKAKVYNLGTVMMRLVKNF